MDKGKPEAKISYRLEKLQIDSAPKILPQSSRSPLDRVKRQSLLSLCIGVIGKQFEDIIPELNEIAGIFPPDIKMSLMAIARRRNLLNDDVLIALADQSWVTLDISDSEVSDFGLAKIAKLCNHLRAVDISCCRYLTRSGVSNLLNCCQSLEVLRWGGCARSDFIARGCLSIFKPMLNHVEGESWEELESMDISTNMESMRWLVWPTIDDCSKSTLATECPRIIVNPKPYAFGFRGINVPCEAFPGVALDDPFVEDIDPRTWGVRSSPRISLPTSDSSELPMAERFRLAFMERDARLAPKRAKNARQHKRRADREWMMNDVDAKSIILASKASKLLHNRS